MSELERGEGHGSVGKYQGRKCSSTSSSCPLSTRRRFWMGNRIVITVERLRSKILPIAPNGSVMLMSSLVETDIVVDYMESQVTTGDV